MPPHGVRSNGFPVVADCPSWTSHGAPLCGICDPYREQPRPAVVVRTTRSTTALTQPPPLSLHHGSHNHRKTWWTNSLASGCPSFKTIDSPGIPIGTPRSWPAAPEGGDRPADTTARMPAARAAGMFLCKRAFRWPPKPRTSRENRGIYAHTPDWAMSKIRQAQTFKAEMFNLAHVGVCPTQTTARRPRTLHNHGQATGKEAKPQQNPKKYRHNQHRRRSSNRRRTGTAMAERTRSARR